jgi:serine protease
VNNNTDQEAGQVRPTYRNQIVVGLLGSLLAAVSLQAASIQPADRPIEGKYIVVLRPEAVFERMPGEGTRQADERGSRELALMNGGQAGRIFTSALRGFTFEGDRWAAERVAADNRVAFVAEDGWVEVSGGVQTPTPSWGLDRIDQRPADLDGEYGYQSEGAGIHVYVVDSGIRSTHSDFGGRVDTVNAFTMVQDGRGTEDCNGHGTHVAGIVGSATYGVAKGVTLHPVRVVDCNGLGPVSNMIAGVDWIASRYAGGGPAQAVVNMSLRAGFSTALETAVSNSIALGLTFVVAAGNDNDDACWLSPGRLPEAITVGASDESDARWGSSNFGTCVDLFAPGTAITSTSSIDDDATLAMTGTSMAAPHVSGAAALVLADHPTATPAEVAVAILSQATDDGLTDVGPGSPNLLLFSTVSVPEVPAPDLLIASFESGDTSEWSSVYPPVGD